MPRFKHGLKKIYCEYKQTPERGRQQDELNCPKDNDCRFRMKKHLNRNEKITPFKESVDKAESRQPAKAINQLPSMVPPELKNSNCPDDKERQPIYKKNHRMIQI